MLNGIFYTTPYFGTVVIQRPVEGTDAVTTSDEVYASTVYRSAGKSKRLKK
jgi:hypothetical protein